MGLSDFNTRRVEVYLSGLTGTADRDAWQRPDHVDLVAVCGASETRRHIFRRSSGPAMTRTAYSDYVRQAQVLFRSVDPRANFAICAGDSRSRFTFPTIVKSRMIVDRDAPCVMLPLDRKRHWRDLPRIAAMDIPFREKDDKIVWRGATTGIFKSTTGSPPYSSRFHVAKLADGKTIDVGYSEIVQLTEDNTDVPLDQIRAKLRPPCSIEEQLRSKYLLSLEGNDVATGLKWMLHSNSAVLMPRPTCESWACEGELVPFEHYIPLKDDLSDIEEVHDWCLSHQTECEEIAMNGKHFVGQYLDAEVEEMICNKVISAYLKVTRIDLPFGPYERFAQRALTPINFGFRQARGKI